LLALDNEPLQLVVRVLCERRRDTTLYVIDLEQLRRSLIKGRTDRLP
jgi:hypothetical protein